MWEEAISALSFWASMSSWLTSTLLFLLLNLMIFTIAFTSGFATQKPAHHHQSDTDVRQHPHLETQLTRTPSILQRFKSLNFNNYISSPQPSTTEIHHNDAPPPPTVAPAPETETHVAEEAVIQKEEEEDEGPTMDEIYSRIIQSKESTSAHNGRQNSDTKPSGGEIPVRLPKKMKKSASNKSAFNHFGAVGRENAAVAVALLEEAEEEETKVDARADDFINKFRQQLNTQRLDSIQRYKEMTTKATAN